MKDNGSETTTSNQNICPVSDSIGETQDSNADNNLKDCSLDKSRHETVACSQDSKIDDQRYQVQHALSFSIATFIYDNLMGFL
jgi:hypothetical protein